MFELKVDDNIILTKDANNDFNIYDLSGWKSNKDFDGVYYRITNGRDSIKIELSNNILIVSNSLLSELNLSERITLKIEDNLELKLIDIVSLLRITDTNVQVRKKPTEENPTLVYTNISVLVRAFQIIAGNIIYSLQLI